MPNAHSLYILSENLSAFSSPPLTNRLFCQKPISYPPFPHHLSPPGSGQKDPNWSRGRKNRDQDPTSAALAVSPERKDVATSGKGKRERVKLSDSCMELGLYAPNVIQYHCPHLLKRFGVGNQPANTQTTGQSISHTADKRTNQTKKIVLLIK